MKDLQEYCDSFSHKDLNSDIETSLDEADEYAAANPERLTHDEVFGRLRRQ